MRMISVEQLMAGMVTALSIYSADGRVLLHKGVTLSDTYINRLRKLHFTYIYIDDNDTDGIEAADSIPTEIRQEVVGRIKEVYDRMMNDGGSVAHLVNSGEVGRAFVQVFEVLYNHIRRTGNLIVHLSAIYSSDAFLYTHCMNVSVMATVLGIAHGYSEDMTKQLGIGAMLHDIGKVEVDPAIINKPSALSPDERKLIETHCQAGYDILRKQPNVSELSALCALLHHERFDGQGYPGKLGGKSIHEFGRLLAVPDVYDALTSNRVYRRAFLPHDALEYLYANTGTQFDPQFVRLFARHVNIYPIGLPVRLSNGSEGVIAKINNDSLSRPVVLILQDHGEKVKPYMLDLSTLLNVVVTECIVSAATA
jgi:HD-GYP domain-containing protein (c-di-GMP phosphodiesterase class II)